MTNLTGAQLRAAFEEMVDDKLSDELTYQLFNLAKNEVESDRAWEILKEIDSSQVTSGNYLTAKTLPSRFINALSLRVGNDRIGYEPVLFESRELFKDASHKYYIKMKDGTFFICGAPQSGQTIYLAHTVESPDIDENTSWVFPSWAHLLIPIVAAKLYYPVNTGEKVRAWDDRWRVEEKVLMDRLARWDMRLKRSSSRSTYDPQYDPNVIY